ncbi:amino acid racemase [Phaeobacter sp. JH18-32]|uniref:aspartate/glutamate racemase family protein n=1 Tax=Phaeobacter TaxID=302485 RepID=UPI003A896296
MKSGRVKLGIVGGLGARGGADILNQLVEATPVRSESDHRDILFEQKPLTETVPVSSPDYTPTHRKFYVFDTLARMEQNGCHVALLPCFITHTFIEELAAELPLELISIGDAIAGELKATWPEVRRIGVLTTPYVRKSRFFEKLLGENCEVVYPDDKAETAMLGAIYGPDGFKAGRALEDVRGEIELVIRSLAEEGVDLVLPGMTELPIILRNMDRENGPRIIDVNAVYATYALRQTSAKKRTPFKVGVVGGVGPAATVDFLRKVVASTAAQRDQDHIKLVVEQNPQIPDRTENLTKGGPDPTIALYSTCKKLEHAGAQIIAIPCNTAHAYVDRLQRHLDIPIVSILSETVGHIQDMKPKVERVAVLGTNGTIASQLYQTALEQKALVPIVPDIEVQAKLMEAIYGPEGVKAGRTKGKCAEQLLDVINEVTRLGAEVAILGCTELPLIEFLGTEKPCIPLVDPTQVLATACVRAAEMFASPRG